MDMERRAMEQKLLGRFDVLEQKLVAADHQSPLTPRASFNDRPQTIAPATLHTENGSAGATVLCERTTKALATELRNSLVSSGHIWKAQQQLDENKVTLTNHPCEGSIRVNASHTPTPTSVPNMTVQDRMHRLELTVLGTTMLYSAWILWNQWTR